MALRKCRDCGTTLSTRALVCPKCGAPQRKSSTISTGCGCLIVLLAGVVIFAVQNQKSPNAPLDGTQRPVAVGAPVTNQPAASNQPVGRPAAEIKEATLANYTNPKGWRMQRVKVTWKNTGNTPIRAIDAEIVSRDASGKIRDSVNYTIFIAPEEEPGVLPGITYTQKGKDEGFILPGIAGRPGYVRAKSVEVRITKVQEHDEG